MKGPPINDQGRVGKSYSLRIGGVFCCCGTPIRGGGFPKGIGLIGRPFGGGPITGG